MRKGIVISLLTAILLSESAIAQTESHPDLEVIAQLRRHGSDLSKPLPLEFYLYFRTEQQARDARRALIAARYHIRRFEPAVDAKAWLVLAGKTMIPAPESVIGSSNQLEAIASEHGGVYDGWESSIVK